MVFGSLFKPKWQHRDPQVRRQAVQELPASDHAVLLQVVREDADAGVRQAALRRVSDLDVLQRSAQLDADPAVRELAQARFLRLLCGEEPGPADCAARIALFKSIADSKMVEHVARHAVERDLRAAAQARVCRDALLGDIALGDPDPELRIAALERVTQLSTLERVARQARGKDKRVYALARDRVQQAREREELPGKLMKSARDACAAVQALVEVTDPAAIAARRAPAVAAWERARAEWEAAALGPFDAELAQRYAEGVAAVDAVLERHAVALAERQARDAHHAKLRQRKQELCERVEAQLRDVRERPDEFAGQELALRQALNLMNAAWRDVEPLPPQEETQWSARFERLTGELAAYAEQAAQRGEAVSALRALLAEVQRLISAQVPPAARQIDALEQRARGKSAPAAPELHAQLVDALAQLRARRAQADAAARAQRDAIASRVTEFEEHVSNGNTQQSLGVQRDIQQALDALAPADLGALRASGTLARFHAASKQLHEWSKWKRWAGKPVKEELVANMEALAREVQATAANELNVRDIAEHVRLAREQWKKLGATESSGPLWKRFDAACTAAYAPCAARFDKEREQRQANAARLEKLCDDLQHYLASTDWENADWNAAERKLRDATRAWERLGAIERGPRKALDARFKALTGEFEQRLHKERTRNKFKKEALIKRARQLVAAIAGENVDSHAVNDAINSAKALQDEWKQIGVSSDVEALWKQFRAEIDAVFARRKAVFDVQDQQRAANLKRKEELCAVIEECAQLGGDAALAARGRVAAARGEYQELGPVPRDAEKKIRARFERAVRDFERRLTDFAAQQQRAQADVLRRKVATCAALEGELDRAARELVPEPEALVRAAQHAQQAWQAEPALAEPLESKLAARLKTALDLAVALGGAGRDAALIDLRRMQEQQRRVAEELCLRLEIATGAETPPEAREARMQFQVRRLADKLAGGGSADDEAEAIETLWYAVGPLSAEDRARLDARFARARHREPQTEA